MLANITYEVHSIQFIYYCLWSIHKNNNYILDFQSHQKNVIKFTKVF